MQAKRGKQASVSAGGVCFGRPLVECRTGPHPHPASHRITCWEAGWGCGPVRQPVRRCRTGTKP